MGRLVQLFALIVTMAVSHVASAEDSRWSYPQQYTVSPKGVNLQTGRFIYSKMDLSIGDLKFVRNWGDVPAMVFTGRAMGTLQTFTKDPIMGWAPPNAGWSHNFNNGVWLSELGDGSVRIYVVIDGKQYNFLQLSDTSVVPAEQGSQGTQLSWAGGQWTFTDRSGASWVFFAYPAIVQSDAAKSNQALQSVTFADGSRVDYSYTAAVQPKLVKSNRGYAIVLDYDSNGNVSAACGYNVAQTYVDTSTTCGSAALKTSYGYSANGANLTSVTDTLGRVVTMSYTAPQAFVSCVTLPNSATCEIQNRYNEAASPFSYQDQITSQTTATGSIWTYSYIPQPDPADVPIVMGQPRKSRTGMQDPNGKGYSVEFDRGHLIKQSTPAGITEYRYAYQIFSVNYGGFEPAQVQYHDAMPRLVTSPEVNRTYFAHDNRGNIVAVSNWPKNSPNPAMHPDPNLQNCCVAIGTPAWPAGAVTYTRTFLGDYGATSVYGYSFVLGCGSGPPDAKRCDKPLTVTDANNNTTDYTYDPAHGGVLTETAPAVNGVRPQTRLSYSQRYAWVKTAGGAYTTAPTPIWVMTQKSLCKTGAASGAGCVTAGDEVRTLYDYGPDSGPNNLQLRGVVDDATADALRTCYSYDWQGNRISETKPRAGLTTCP